MRKILKYLFLLFLSFHSCEKKKTNLSVKSDSISKHLSEIISSDFYNPKTPCVCNDDGTEILNEILIQRKAYKNIKALENDVDTNNYIEVLKKNWDTIRWKCLKTFGTAMFTPSNCNNPDNIQTIKDELMKLGIQT